jgi:putative nucleotidyltransferase with HDIG domain
MESVCLIESIGHHIESIPTLESSRMRLFKILQEESSTLENIQDVVSSDPAMAAKVMRLANSSFYRHSENPVGILQALMTIGLDMVKCIALSMSIMEAFGRETALAKSLWRHSYLVGLIARLFGGSRSEKECLFTGGLLHDLGRMVLLCKVPEEYVPLYEFDGYWPDTNLEKDIFSMDHSAIGGMVAERWHFPPDVIRIITHHHEPVDNLSALVYLTDQIVSQKERGITGNELKHTGLLSSYLGEQYKELVNIIQQRYTTSSVIVENLG